MSKKSKKQAGTHLMEVAEGRDKEAGESYRYALVLRVLFAPALIFSIITLFWLGIAISLVGLFYARRFSQDGKRNTQGAENAYQGAAAEREVEVLLKLLERKKWQIDHNVPRPGGGDIDVVLHSPKGNWYVIDVKSHPCTKIIDRGRLKKRCGNQIHDVPEGDLISKVKGQAKEVRKSKSKGRWVTPLLCFTRGDVEDSGNEARGVYIVSKSDLIDTLERLDRQ